MALGALQQSSIKNIFKSKAFNKAEGNNKKLITTDSKSFNLKPGALLAKTAMKKNNFERIEKSVQHTNKIGLLKKHLNDYIDRTDFLFKHFKKDLKNKKSTAHIVLDSMNKDFQQKKGLLKRLEKNKRENFQETRKHKAFKTNRKLFGIIQNIKLGRTSHTKN